MNRFTRSSATLLLSFGCLGFLPAHAQQNCSAVNNNFDSTYCLNKVFMQADSDLNSSYQKLRARLGPQGKERLLISQRRWTAARDR